MAGVQICRNIDEMGFLIAWKGPALAVWWITIPPPLLAVPASALAVGNNERLVECIS